MEEDDHISRLPDAVLGEIVSLLRTKEGCRTQTIASRWRHIWSTAPLNIDLHDRPPIERRIRPAQISGILSSHRGPGRRFSIPGHYFDKDDHPTATLDACAASPSRMHPFWKDYFFLGMGLANSKKMVISVISAPKLKILGQLPVGSPILKFGTSIFEGSCVVNSTMVLPSVKILALTHICLSLDEVIAFMKCFPCLENLYIKMSTIYLPSIGEKVTNEWRHKYQSLIGTLDIRLKKIVLSTYLGNQAHVNFAEFFVLNARVLKSMVLEVDVSKYHNKEWIERQQTLLQIKERASRDARFDFVSSSGQPKSRYHYWYEQVHDFSTADPFVGFDFWADG